MPDARTTSVAAGTPITVTAAAAARVAQVRASAGIRQLKSAHTPTVATDPQVPGPGLSRPIPPKVATTVAHCGVSGRDVPATATLRPAFATTFGWSVRNFRPHR